MKPFNGFFVLTLLLLAFSVEAKSPPPGSGKADVPANILFMVDTSGSMRARTTNNSGIQHPIDVAVDSNGNRFVVSWSYHHILKYDSAGTYLKTIGRSGSGKGQFRYPASIAIDSNDNIYVAEYYNDRVQKLTNDGEHVRYFTGIYRAWGVTVDSSGNVYASSPNHNIIRKWDSSGTYKTEWPSSYPYGLSAYGGNIYSANGGSRKFYKYSSTGTTLGGSPWTASNNAWPVDIEVTANGIYLLNANHYVQKYNSSGTYVTQWGGYGSTNTTLHTPHGLGSDSSGNVYVADFYNNAVKKFDSDLTFDANATIVGFANTRLGEAKKVIKKLVSSSDLTSGANFGLMDWNHRAIMKVNVSSQGAAQIYNTLDSLRASGGTYLDSAMNLARSYFTGANSPMDKNASCQKNILIVISDGVWYDRQASNIAKKLYASWGIETFVIGFHTGGNSNYIKLAKAGGTYPESPLYSSNWQHLSATLSSYIRQAINSRLTFSAPAVMPGFSSVDTIFQPLFTYKKDHQWEGHLEKHRLKSDGSIGAIVWDAGKKLDSQSASSRKIWTVAESEGITTSLTNFTTSNVTGLKNLIWEGSGKVPTDAEAMDLINFVRGIDAYDEDGDGSSTDKRWKLADIYHSALSVVGAPSETTNQTELKTEGYYRNSENYNNFKSGTRCGGPCFKRTEVVYAGANDGMLHAFDSKTGAELWAFIPPNMLPNLRNMISAKANTSHSIFGVDGSPVVRDVYYDGTWRTLLLAGMGRGGHGYFALDVTNPDAPSFLYAFSHDPTNQEVSHWDAAGNRTKLGYASGIPAEYDYSKLGEAWSTPIITAMPYQNSRKWVAVIGGGYNAGVNTNYGSAIYVIDLEDEGKVLKRIDLTNTSGNIANAVPATLMAITPDTTSAADYKGALVYFADLESKLWKLNLTDLGTLYEITQVFDGQGTQENGRFSFHQVEASLDQNKTLWLYYGTGDYQKLQRTDSQIQNRLFAIKDKEFPKFKVANSPGNLSSLKNTSTAGGVCPSVADLGWYINLNTNEKITGKIAVSNEVVFASRYTPNNSNACSPGTSSISEHNYTCGNNGSSTNLGAGVATGVVVHKGKLYVGISGTPQTTSSLPAGWTKKGNIVQGIPKSGAWNKGTVNVESWREVW